MSKRTKPSDWEPEIDQEYESRVNSLAAIDGSVTDYAGTYEIEPVRQQPPKTWTPAQGAKGSEVAQRMITSVMQAQPTSEFDSVFQPMHGAIDNTSASDKARALSIKMFWQVGMLALAGLAIVIVALIVGAYTGHMGTSFTLGTVTALVVIYSIGSKRLNQLVGMDYEYSREGTERHRIDKAADIHMARMEHDAKLKEMALGAVLKQLGVSNDGK